MRYTKSVKFKDSLKMYERAMKDWQRNLVTFGCSYTSKSEKAMLTLLHIISYRNPNKLNILCSLDLSSGELLIAELATDYWITQLSQ